MTEASSQASPTATARRGFAGAVRAPGGRQTAASSCTEAQLRGAAAGAALYSWDPDYEYRYTDVFPQFSKDRVLVTTDLSSTRPATRRLLSTWNGDGYSGHAASSSTRRARRCWQAGRLTASSSSSASAPSSAAAISGRRTNHDDERRRFQREGIDGRRAQRRLSGLVARWQLIVYRVWGYDDKRVEQRGLRLMNLADRSIKVLTSEWDNFPFFSPRRPHPVHAAEGERQGLRHLHHEAGRHGRQQLTTWPGTDGHATWTPDGKQILFMGTRTGFKDEAPMYDNSPQPVTPRFSSWMRTVRDADSSPTAVGKTRCRSTSLRPVACGRRHSGTTSNIQFKITVMTSHVQLTIAVAMLGFVAAGGGSMAQQPERPPLLLAALDTAAVDRGRDTFRANCGLAMAPERARRAGPDLARSLEVLNDEDGKELGDFLRVGIPERGMPAFAALQPDAARDISAFLHTVVEDARRQKALDPNAIVVGDPKAGEVYFNGTGRAARVTRRPATSRGSVRRYRSGDAPGSDGRSARSRREGAAATDNGGSHAAERPGTSSGRLVAITDFYVTLIDDTGARRTFARDNDVPKVHVHDPLKAHLDMFLKWTDADMHNVTAYLWG